MLSEVKYSPYNFRATVQLMSLSEICEISWILLGESNEQGIPTSVTLIFSDNHMCCVNEIIRKVADIVYDLYSWDNCTGISYDDVLSKVVHVRNNRELLSGEHTFFLGNLWKITD